MWLLRLRYSLRSLARDPAFVLIVVMVFSLGVAANTILLTVIDRIVLHPLPYRDPDGLVMIWEANPSLDEPQASRGRVAWNNFREWQTQTDVFDGIEANERAEYNLTGRGNPERLVAAHASTGFFRMLGVPAQQGRTFWHATRNTDHAVIDAYTAMTAYLASLCGRPPLHNCLPLHRANDAMHDKGIPFDLTQIKPENLEELIEQLNDPSVDEDQRDQETKVKVGIFCE